jgi:hypothetical protein
VIAECKREAADSGADDAASTRLPIDTLFAETETEQ